MSIEGGARAGMVAPRRYPSLLHYENCTREQENKISSLVSIKGSGINPNDHCWLMRKTLEKRLGDYRNDFDNLEKLRTKNFRYH